MKRVVLARCEDYQQQKVEKAVGKIFEHLEGINQLVGPGTKVLLKPNVLAPRTPDKAVTTHPEVVKAVAVFLLAKGAKVMVGDSSGGVIAGRHPTAQSLKVSGIEGLGKELGIEVINFDTVGTSKVKVGGKFLAEVEVARPVLECDLFINLPKFKTHSATLITGAVKNLYGIIPGTRKAYYHRKAANPQDFAELLVDLQERFPPDLNIVDAVVAMEGNGPANGKPYPLGFLVAGREAARVDALCCLLVGLKPGRVRHLKACLKRGLVEDLENLEIVGDLVPLPAVADFKLPNNMWFEMQPAGVVRWFLARLEFVPVIDKEKCSSCAVCVESCPTGSMSMDQEGKVLIARDNCIECMCCQEMCPRGAIEILPVSLVGKLAKKFLGDE